METFPALLTISAGNSAVTGEFPSQRPVTRSFGVLFYLNGRVNNHRETGDLRRHRAHYDATVVCDEIDITCGYFRSDNIDGLQQDWGGFNAVLL